MPRDLSGTPGNPTHALQQNYERLMAIDDPAQLRDALVKIVGQLRGSGMSERNYRMFMLNLQKIGDDIDNLKRYVTNYILRGSGLGVIEDKVVAMATFIGEDCSYIELNPQQQYLKQLVEAHGFHVGLI